MFELVKYYQKINIAIWLRWWFANIFFLIPIEAGAANSIPKLPDGISSPQGILEQMRSGLVGKLDELHSSYPFIVDPLDIRYLVTPESNCGNYSSSSKETVRFQIHVNSQLQEQSRIDTFMATGCAGANRSQDNILFTEVLTTRGENLKLTPLDQLVKGVLPFSEEVISQTYTLTVENTVLIEAIYTRSPRQASFTVNSYGTSIYSINETFSENNRHYEVKMNSDDFSTPDFKVTGGKVYFSASPFDPDVSTLISMDVNKTGRFLPEENYFDEHGHLLGSKIDFLNELNHGLYAKNAEFKKEYYENLIINSLLPPAKLLTVVGELKLATEIRELSKLVLRASPTDLTQAKQILKGIQEAISDRQIQDKRK